jgi:hypothetical protein
LEDKKKTEEELRNVTTSHDLAVKFNEETLADQEKEMKRLETREDLLRVFFIETSIQDCHIFSIQKSIKSIHRSIHKRIHGIQKSIQFFF